MFPFDDVIMTVIGPEDVLAPSGAFPLADWLYQHYFLQNFGGYEWFKIMWYKNFSVDQIILFKMAEKTLQDVEHLTHKQLETYGFVINRE